VWNTETPGAEGISHDLTQRSCVDGRKTLDYLADVAKILRTQQVCQPRLTICRKGTAVELAVRPRGDVFTQPGEFLALRARVREMAAGLDIPSVVVYAFDPRTRILPFLFADKRMVPAGVRVVGSTLHDCGLTHTRIVLQQWTPHFRPSVARVDGRPPEMLLVGSMQIHAEKAYQLIADACTVPESQRPLILAGGPKAIYEPWDVFAIGGDPNVSVDLAVRGEAFVLAQLLEVLLAYRKSGGTMRQAFEQARRERALEDVLGLVYRPDNPSEAPGCLIDTGTQRLVEDLDELPPILDGYRLLEPPHRRATLSARPLELNRVRRHAPIAPLVITHGCKFRCDFCPIPAANQRTFRSKSGQRLADEMELLNRNAGIKFFFGTCDNFFNDRERAEEILVDLVRRSWDNRRLKNHVRWGTESTQYDAYKNLDLMQLGARGPAGALVRHRGSDRRVGQEGPERRIGRRAVPRTRSRRHLPHADDGPSRCPAAAVTRQPVGADQPGRLLAPGGRRQHAGLQPDAVGRLAGV